MLTIGNTTTVTLFECCQKCSKPGLAFELVNRGRPFLRPHELLNDGLDKVLGRMCESLTFATLNVL